GGQGWREIDRDGMPAFTLTSTWSLAVAVVPLLGVLMVAGIAVNLGQTGFLYLPQKVALNWSHINPLSNAQRVFSVAGLVRLSFGLFKVAIVLGVAAWSLWSEQRTLMNLAELEAPQVAAY